MAWADEGEALFFHAPGKFRVFGQEAIAGMDGGGAALAGCFQDGGDIQVFLLFADGNCFVCIAHMQGGFVHIREDRHGRQAHFLAGAQDADGDLPTVGNQYFHLFHMQSP